MGVAITTEPTIAKSVPQSIGKRLYSPAVGFQEESVKKRVSPTWLRTGRDSKIRKTIIKSAIAPAITAKERSIQINHRSFGDEDKVLLFNNLTYLLRLSEINKFFC